MSDPTSARRWVYSLLETDESAASRWINQFLMILIILNVVAVVTESVDEIYRDWAPWFDWFEVVSVFVFTVEYLGRTWVCVERSDCQPGVASRLRYLVSPMALIDLLAILPFYLGAIFNIDLRFLRALRLLRIFKLARHSTAMDLLLTVIRNEAAIVGSSLLVMMIVIVIAASGIYLIERDAQPEAFQSIPQAMWWAAVTLTTVGYGDVVPVTVAGKVFGLLITVAGVGMVALPAGILASGFSQELHKRRTEFELQVRKSLADRKLSKREIRKLAAAAEELGLDEEEARLLLDYEATSASGPELTCPHCGKRFRAGVVAGQKDHQ